MPTRNKETVRRIKKAAELLAYLNIARVRCTYGAFGDVLGVPARSVGWFLGEKRREASWVVNSSCFMPTDYNASQKHPNLTRRRYKFLNSVALERRMNEGWEVSVEGIEEWRKVLARELLAYLSSARRLSTHGAFGKVLGISASSVRLYLKELHEDGSWVIGKGEEQMGELSYANTHSQSATQRNEIESGLELEKLMRDNWQFSSFGALSIRDMPISPKCSWWSADYF